MRLPIASILSDLSVALSGAGRAADGHARSDGPSGSRITQDLASFWQTTYFDVRNDLRGRYPKHHWPEDPLTAPPRMAPGRPRR